MATWEGTRDHCLLPFLAGADYAEAVPGGMPLAASPA